jgi:hypothetical protein
MKKTLALFALLALGGCRSVLETVRTRASFDFPCDKAQIEVSNLGDDVYGARGCDKQTKCRDIPFVGIDCDPASSLAPPVSASKPAPPPLEVTPPPPG